MWLSSSQLCKSQGGCAQKPSTVDPPWSSLLAWDSLAGPIACSYLRMMGCTWKDPCLWTMAWKKIVHLKVHFVNKKTTSIVLGYWHYSLLVVYFCQYPAPRGWCPPAFSSLSLNHVCLTSTLIHHSSIIQNTCMITVRAQWWGELFCSRESHSPKLMIYLGSG